MRQPLQKQTQSCYYYHFYIKTDWKRNGLHNLYMNTSFQRNDGGAIWKGSLSKNFLESLSKAGYQCLEKPQKSQSLNGHFQCWVRQNEFAITIFFFFYIVNWFLGVIYMLDRMIMALIGPSNCVQHWQPYISEW